jgi:hypothetical protein
MSLAGPSVEPTDDDLLKLLQRVFSAVAEQNAEVRALPPAQPKKTSFRKRLSDNSASAGVDLILLDS